MVRRRLTSIPVMCLALLRGCASYQSQREQSGMVVGGLLCGLTVVPNRPVRRALIMAKPGHGPPICRGADVHL